jgi:hypothetical protein
MNVLVVYVENSFQHTTEHPLFFALQNAGGLILNSDPLFPPFLLLQNSDKLDRI